MAWQCRAVAGTVALLEEVCRFDCNKGLLITTISSHNPGDGEMKLMCCLDDKLITLKCESSCTMVNSNVIMYNSYLNRGNDWHLWTMAHLGNFILLRHGEILAIWHGGTISVISSGKWIYIYCFLWFCCCLFKPFFVFPVVRLLCLSEHLNAAEFPLRTDKVALKSSFNGFHISTWCVHNKINHQALFLLQSQCMGTHL